jgi:hypothetical protein
MNKAIWAHNFEAHVGLMARVIIDWKAAMALYQAGKSPMEAAVLYLEAK